MKWEKMRIDEANTTLSRRKMYKFYKNEKG
jgi:hypothetical protein